MDSSFKIWVGNGTQFDQEVLIFDRDQDVAVIPPHSATFFYFSDKRKMDMALHALKTRWGAFDLSKIIDSAPHNGVIFSAERPIPEVVVSRGTVEERSAHPVTAEPSIVSWTREPELEPVEHEVSNAAPNGQSEEP